MELQVCKFIKKRLQRICFPRHFEKLFKTHFCTEHLLWQLLAGAFFKEINPIRTLVYRFIKLITKKDRYFITVLQQIDASSTHFFPLLFKLRIVLLTKARFKQFIFMDNAIPSGFNVSLQFYTKVPLRLSP